MTSHSPSHETPPNDPPTTADAAQAAAGDGSPESVIESLRGEVEQMRAEMLRERADLENQRKRLAREVEMARKFANERLLGDLLPLFDSIEAGLAAASAQDPLRAGLELTMRQLERVAEANGLIAIAPKAGEVFNPDHHQAMSMVEPPEGIAPGAIAQTFQKGFLLNDRLLRPALVVVARED